MSTAPLLRVEDERLLRGRGRFVTHLRVPGMLAAWFVRSPHAHARIASIDTREARALPGVVAVLTAQDLGEIAMPAVNPLVTPLGLPDRSPLARERVRAVGDAVALVVATDASIAQRGAGLVAVEYEALAPVADPGAEAAAADASDAPIYASVPGNVAARIAFDAGDPAHGFATAAHRVEVRLRQARTAAVAMEPRAVLAEPFDERPAESLRVHLPCQSPARARDDIARALGLARDAVRVIAPDVGGAFGAKASLGVDELVVIAAAWRIKRALHWVASRSDEFQAAPQGRGAHVGGSLAVAGDGRLLALRAELAFPLGAWLPFSAFVPMRNAARILPGPYRIEAIEVRGAASLSNTAPVSIYRGAGRPEAAILVEALLDAAARRLAMDPVALRLRNFIAADEMPAATPTGERLDSGDFAATLRRACSLASYDQLRQRQRERRAAGELVGIGVACYVEPCGQGWESARLTALADGSFEVASGSSAQGQGHETSFAHIAARGLGEFAPAQAGAIRVIQGDTARCPDGIGALASRSIAIGGSAILAAAERLRERLAAGATRPCAVEQVYHAPAEAWSAGALIAAVRIEPDTGAIHVESIAWADDAGEIIDPVLAEGQLRGGLAQGLGQALCERIVYDHEGQLLTGSLMDYALPRAADMPPVRLDGLASASSANRLGAKGVGEAGCIGVPAALFNAVADALSALPRAEAAIAALQLPMTPERVWQAILAGGRDGMRTDHEGDRR